MSAVSDVRTIPEEFAHQIGRFIDGELPFPLLDKWTREHFNDILAIDSEALRKLFYEIEVSATELKDGHATEDGIRKTLHRMMSFHDGHL